MDIRAWLELNVSATMDTVELHKHDFPKSEWPFADPENAAAFSTVQVFKRGFPILHVSHDDDGGWQVLCGTTSDVNDGMVVCLGCAYQHDRSIGQLADLPPGWIAWRETVEAPWQREQKLPEGEEASP